MSEFCEEVLDVRTRETIESRKTECSVFCNARATDLELANQVMYRMVVLGIVTYEFSRSSTFGSCDFLGASLNFWDYNLRN